MNAPFKGSFNNDVHIDGKEGQERGGARKRDTPRYRKYVKTALRSCV